MADFKHMNMYISKRGDGPSRAEGSLKAENRLKVYSLVLILHNLELVTNLVFLSPHYYNRNKPPLLPTHHLQDGIVT